MSISRRSLLKYGVGAGALCAAGWRPSRLSAETAKKIPIALQLYSLRDVAGKDVPGTLDAVAKLGYQGVEFAGYYGLKAAELRKMLDQSGLKCCGTHIGIDTLIGDALQETVAFNKALGNPYLIVSSLAEPYRNSLASLAETAKLFTDLAAKLKELDMRVGYHAHAFDFVPVADRIPWEVLFSNAGPDVLMQLDTGNCMQGGGDPVEILKKFPHRSLTIHLKAFGGSEGAPIGEDKVPWKSIFELCETTGDTQWYIVEQESYQTSSIDSVKSCIENLRKMGK